MALYLRLLGPVEMLAHGVNVNIGGPKARAFLAMLLLNPNEAVSLDRLTDSLWEEQPPPSAIANLRNYAASIRAALRRSGDVYSARLIADNGRYQLRVEQKELDVRQFEVLATEGREALRRMDWSGARHLLDQARRLWRGKAAENVARSAVLDSYLVALDECRLGVEEDHVEALLALGDCWRVIGRLRQFLIDHPYRERAWELLMLALYRSGDAVAGLAAYEQVRKALVDGLGIEPSASLARLQCAILQRDPRLTSNEGLRILDHPSAERAATAPLVSVVPRQLPAAPVPFVGREAECAQLDRILTGRVAEAPAVVAISGPPGVGKSALALRAAHEHADRFPDGQVYLDLLGTRSDRPPLTPVDTLNSLLTALGDDRAPSLPWPAATARLRSLMAARRLLIILDNIAEFRQIKELIPAGPHSLVLLTSRRVLAPTVTGHRLDLRDLPSTQALALLDQILLDNRVREEPGAGRQLVDLCERRPLAVTIVGGILAARPDLPLSTYAGRLVDERTRLTELEFEHLSVRSALWSSYRCLLDSCRPIDRLATRIFEHMGLIPAGKLYAAEVAARLGVSVSATEAALGRLVRERLLTDCPADGAYRRSDLVRLFAAEQAKVARQPDRPNPDSRSPAT
ncbi:hypothetical protein GCM10027280_37980 [Micromonospora polyrhachis]|uniref:DNA-binding SARP family transcriptional activator n=1 Tax=Micromonospora polyrhachis TaxID=1282883 RepID=A0A7W7WTE7_9ACTN|nr:AfsR/SARP family transcriptional regulator [Micromonospora polyrhachis]MBB4962388.1 DNA-binding SARP family transcriptional activator [Micromonospora polyrhachis]